MRRTNEKRTWQSDAPIDLIDHPEEDMFEGYTILHHTCSARDSALKSALKSTLACLKKKALSLPTFLT